MLENEKNSGLDPVVVFLLISLLIHGLLFYFLPKLGIILPKPKKKSEKPITVQLIEEPVKGKNTPPKKATVLGKKNITVKKETRPENKPKVSGQKKVAKLQPPPAPPQQPGKPKIEAKKPEIKLTPPPKKPPAVPKKLEKPKPKPSPPPKKAKSMEKKPETVKPTPPKPKKAVIATPKKEKIKVARAKPKPRTPTSKKTGKETPPKKSVPSKKTRPTEKGVPPSSTPPTGTAPKTKASPTPRPKTLFPSAETLHQIERKFSQTYPKDVQKGDVISLNTKEFKYISYFTHIKHKIELVWEYPRAAAEMGQEGSLLLLFTILKDGRLGGIKLLRSSGYRLLDQEAIRAVKAAAPFNPIPDRLHKNRLNIMATFNYSLGFKFVY